MENLREMTNKLLSELKRQQPANETLEWYLINNLEGFGKALTPTPSKSQLASATAALSRFCTDSMDWNSDLFKAVTKITALGTTLSKR